MKDLGNELTEKELSKLEKRIKKEYKQAALELQKKVDDYMQKFAKEDAKKAQEVKEKKITFGEYRTWRKNKMLTGNRYKELKDKLVNDMVNADKKAVEYVSETLPNIYAININYETYNAEKEIRVDTSFTLYNEDTVKKLIKENPQLLPINPNLDIPKDVRWNKRHINSAITQGILQGEGIPKIAKRLERVTNMDRASAIRNARTCVTSAQNAGRLDAMKREESMGIALKKVWIATLDSRTRDSHVLLDGEEREINEKFSNGLEHPADPNGEPSEVYNCRCRMVTQIDKYRTDWSDLKNRNNDKLGGMSYDEWKEAHKPKAKEEEKPKKEKIIDKPKEKKEESKKEKVINKPKEEPKKEKVIEKPKEKQKNEQMQKQKAKIQNVDKMNRSQLERTAYKIAVNLAPTQNISPEEALRRARLLMPVQSIPQLRKYIRKYKKYL